MCIRDRVVPLAAALETFAMPAALTLMMFLPLRVVAKLSGAVIVGRWFPEASQLGEWSSSAMKASLYSEPTNSGNSSERNLKRKERQLAPLGTLTRIRQMVTSLAPRVLAPPSAHPVDPELFLRSAKCAQPVERIAKDPTLRGHPAMLLVVVATGRPPGGTVTNLARTSFLLLPSKIDRASLVAPSSERETGLIGWFFLAANAAAASAATSTTIATSTNGNALRDALGAR